MVDESLRHRRGSETQPSLRSSSKCSSRNALLVFLISLLAATNITFMLSYSQPKHDAKLVAQQSRVNRIRDDTKATHRQLRDPVSSSPFEDNVLRKGETAARAEYPSEVLPKSAVFDISDTLNSCSASSKARTFEKIGEDFHQEAINALGSNKCSAPMPWKKFVCLAQCPAVEPELEQTMQAQRIAQYPLWLMNDLCRRKIFPVLFYIRSGKVMVKKCTDDRIRGTQVWKDMTRLLVMLKCVVELPDVVFGLDNADWAVPQRPDPFESFHWNNIVPAVIRLVRVDSHPSLLWPTGPFVYHSGYCHIRSSDPRKWFLRCPHDTFSSIDRWKQKRRGICWRGSMTGVPMYQGLARYLPRSAIAKVAKLAELDGVPGYNIGIVGNGYGVNSALRRTGYMDVRSFKSSMDKNNMYEYQYVLHVDGHTASWGLTDKLTSGTVVLWHESPLHFKEHFYVHLEPWKHYIPLDISLSNMEGVRHWAMNEDNIEQRYKLAQKMVDNNIELFRTKLRGEATFCYLMRLLYSLAEVQEVEPTEQAMEDAGFDLADFRLLNQEKEYRQGMGLSVDEDELFW